MNLKNLIIGKMMVRPAAGISSTIVIIITDIQSRI